MARETKRGAVGSLAAGFVLAIMGFGLILYEIWATATIPLNDVTFIGIALGGLGVGLGAIGMDRAYAKG
jgi:hypothetical protein